MHLVVMNRECCQDNEMDNSLLLEQQLSTRAMCGGCAHSFDPRMFMNEWDDVVCPKCRFIVARGYCTYDWHVNKMDDVLSNCSSSSSSISVDLKRSKSRYCSVPGCVRGIRSRGLCKGHGGGRRCKEPTCGLSDQGGGYCISHGGGKRCSIVNCENSSQSRGLCKKHGGGSRCSQVGCQRSSQSHGLCRTHGGGRRCLVAGCNKTDRRAGYCVTHGAEKKCKLKECTRTGRLDGYCTKHTPTSDKTPSTIS
ncbi:hypothetical protein THRCLA_01486 [Thraustotheca clavata]|uniref:WRKY19-like zinc finger domain-containing protein n=1 Tax=Thraustotheca clavata TaxID=74557 RepID=A0A1W0A852_9STRA|nr:hypothetical protein THRCLA_01486 [Thraustotheca clavata]